MNDVFLLLLKVLLMVKTFIADVVVGGVGILVVTGWWKGKW